MLCFWKEKKNYQTSYKREKKTKKKLHAGAIENVKKTNHKKKYNNVYRNWAHRKQSSRSFQP